MTDISVTAASVLASAGATLGIGTAGEALTAGQPVYKDATDSGKIKACDANASAAASACVGIALHTSANNQPIEYATGGDINMGATLVVGQVYITSANAGGVAPVSDLTTGWYTTVLGVATTTANLRLSINAGGVAKA